MFDIDGTIFRSSLLIELVERLIAERVFPPETRDAYEDVWQRWLDRQGPYEDYIMKVVELFQSQIKGKPYEEVANIAGEVIEEQRFHTYR